MTKISQMIKSMALLLSIMALSSPLRADRTGDGLAEESLLPKTIKPIEPTMASLGRYGNYQVNLFNGLPQISFTLFEVRSGALTQPITLSYHGGGIKVGEDAGWVGLGWDLFYGGAITRTVYGLPDEEEDFADTPNAQTVRTQMNVDPSDIYNTYFDALAEGFSYSYMQDQYQFNCQAGNGMFVLNNTNIPLLIPHQPLSIDFSGVTKQINNADQTSFLFRATDQTSISGKDNPYVSSWSIDQILSRDRKDTIRYNYQSDGYISNINRRKYDGYIFNSTPEGSTYSRIGLQNSTSVMEVQAQKPQYIFFKDGKLEFILSDRYDIYSSRNAQSPINHALKKLDRIIVYRKGNDGLYNPIKQIKFYYSYFGTESPPTSPNPDCLRLRLDRVTELVGSEERLIAFFQYHNGLPPKTSYSTDHWGYYNGAANPTPIVGFQMNYQYINGATKSSVAANMLAGSLFKITYPTGGSTIFNWEANDVYTNNTIILGENNQTYSIKENDISGYSQLDHTTSGNPNPDDPVGMLVETISINKTQTVYGSYRLYREDTNDLGHNNYDTGALTITDNNNNNIIFHINSLSSPTQQPLVLNLTAGHSYSVKIEANCTNVKGDLAFEYIQLPESGNYLVGGLRIESIVNQDIGETIVSTKKYSYKMPDNPLISSGYAKTDFTDVDYSTSQRSYLKWEDEIQGDPGTFLECRRKMVQRVVYYSDPMAGIYSSPVCYQYVKEVNYSGGADNGYSLSQFSVCPDSNPTKDILISNEWKRGDLVQKEVFLNNGSYQLIQKTNYKYSLHPNFNPQSIGFKMYRLLGEVETSCGISYNYENTITLNEIYEPFNYYYESGWKHLDTTIVRNYYDGTEVTEESNFIYSNSVHCKPSLVNQQLSGKTLSVENTYLGNTGLVTNRKEKLGNTVIKEENIIYNSDLQPSIFKEISSNQVDFNKHTYTYDAQKNLIELTKENDISTAIIWGCNQQYPVAKITSGNIIGVPPSIRSSIASHSFDQDGAKLSIDSDVSFLRSALSYYISNNAFQVTMFTYSPLVGMTSQTDSNGKTLYYSYDSFGRMKTMMDHDGKLVKKYEYHYINGN